MSGERLDRRDFIAATTGAAAASLVSSRTSKSQSYEPNVRAAVLEFEDRWTQGATGVKQLLTKVGVHVNDLVLSQSPLGQPESPHLIVFGSFTNNSDDYLKYVKEYSKELRQFVAQGGVLLEMTQSDQYGNTVSYLPAGMVTKRGDRDLSTVFAIAANHPLVEPWIPTDETSKTNGVGVDFFGREDVNWESFDYWENMQVLLASSSDATSPCLLEGEYGKGRFVVSSLYVDKCYRGNQVAFGETSIQRGEGFFAAVKDYVRLVLAGKAPLVKNTVFPKAPPTGPMVGHVDHQLARIWFRPNTTGTTSSSWKLTLTAENGNVTEQKATPDPDHDFTIVFDVEVKPDTKYDYRIDRVGSKEKNDLTHQQGFKSAPAPGTPSRWVVGMGSCAPSDPNHVWQRVIDEGCEGFVFLGDTPYVDSNQLFTAREKHRQFLAQPEISRMISRMPCWGTWDDHDFGKNDGHGDFPGKHVCRTAFTEYRANASFGHDLSGEPQRDRFGGGRGIYTSFRRGPLEVFLIDPRWFSRTEASWADSDQPTCLGKVQWKWLKEGLSKSTASFKALATGMIWDDKTNSEKDDWHTYRHEREAIFDFIRDQGISGCFLIGGDIHVSRALNHGPRVGYDLWEFIVSPLHGSTIPQLDVPHPKLVHHALEPFVFLRLDVDDRANPATLQADWINRDGKRIFSVSLDATKLKKR